MTQQPAAQHNPFSTPQSDVRSEAKTHVLAVVGLVLALLPIPGLNLLGILMGAIAWSQINAKPNELKGRGIAIAAVIGGAVWMFFMVFGILAAIAIPNFIKYQTRAKQSEAKAFLKAVSVQQEMYRAENDTYAVSFEQLGWAPEPGRLYSYYLGSSKVDSDKGPVFPPAETPGTPTADGFRAYAVANLDSDSTLDLWTIDQTKQLENVINDDAD